MNDTTRDRTGSNSTYKWGVVGMLWLVCFFNYADRQAIFSLFPLIKQQLQLSNFQLGVIGSSFMWMYAVMGPVAGMLCDRWPRKFLILGALVFWSVVTGATALTHSYAQMVLCRALGGLGEAFYLPAAMSLISDYHGASTRSRAMSLHQSSVYVGTLVGGTLSGIIGQYYGWRSTFSILGGAGVILGMVLVGVLREPVRGMSESADPAAVTTGSLVKGFAEVMRNRSVLLLIAVFIGANFVAVVFLSWMPTFLYEKFKVSLSMASLNAVVYLQFASVLGVLSGGVLADARAKRRRGGRLFVQALGLLCGVPFLFFAGSAGTMTAVVLSMLGLGYFKGIYDSNIFASLYDVVPVRLRGTAAGLLNSLGWLGAGFAPIAVAIGSARYGMGPCISATAVIYLGIGLLLLWGSHRLARSRRQAALGT